MVDSIKRPKEIFHPDVLSYFSNTTILCYKP